ncbi:FAS-associated factor 1 [Folsomia candida]|uniref:FAS-associated factor 1 n=1 Tax=Folsomia candida TaxID=158441 RepID=A0A226E1L2_FOLCA|nr:FAS-associated factor 1 [Folsomia candida]
MEEQKLTEEMKVQEAAEQAKMLRDQIATTLPPEPDTSCTDPVCSLKCRLPGGKIISRRFLQSTTLNVLFDFLFTKGFHRTSIDFDNLADLVATTTMNGIFSPQDTLIVELR